jgi:hypothetical protein
MGATGMKLLRNLKTLSVLILFALVPPAAAQTEAAQLAAVEQSFLAYKSAILTSDGAAAADLVTGGSHDYYRGLADKALTLDRQELHEIHLGDRLNAMLLRHSLKAEKLRSMSGEEVVAYAVDHGWIGREGADRLQLGGYVLEGDTASGSILRPDGQASAYTMDFVKEDGRWLLDLVALVELTRTAFEYTVEQTGLSEDDFVILMLEHATGRKPGPDIWSPPL